MKYKNEIIIFCVNDIKLQRVFRNDKRIKIPIRIYEKFSNKKNLKIRFKKARKNKNKNE